MKIPTKFMMLVAAMVATAGICAAQGNGGGGSSAPTKPAGTVTQVNTGDGLTGGPITTTGTISVNFGGSGAALTVSRSDHNHDSRYLKLAGGTLSTDGPQIVPAFGNIGFGNGPGSTFFLIRDNRVPAPVSTGNGVGAQTGFIFNGGNGGDTPDTGGNGGGGGGFQVFAGRGGKGDSFDDHEGGWGAMLGAYGGGGGLGNNDPNAGGGQGGGAYLRGGDGGYGGGAGKPGGRGGSIFIDGGTGGDVSGNRGPTGDVFINTLNAAQGFRGNTWVGGNLLFYNSGDGILLRSPDGNTCKTLTLTNAGGLLLTAVTCP
jgi:hypothetical protein